jgi:hypothetical protein
MKEPAYASGIYQVNIGLPSGSPLGKQQGPEKKTDEDNAKIESFGIVSVDAVHQCAVDCADTQMLSCPGTRDSRTGRSSRVFDSRLCSHSARECAGVNR